MEKETIELVKKMIEDGNLSQEIAEKYCPELKSEDERIRKALIKYIKGITSWNYFLGISKEQMIAWLEKQGEQEYIDPDTLIQQRVDALADIVTEQKPDKVEPKFKAGDWIIHNTYYNLIYYVDSILSPQSNCYCLNSNGGTRLMNFSEQDNYHLWTIQDAKDGDVLATKAGGIFIYKELLYDKPFAYCGVDKFGVFKDCNCGNGLDWTPYLSDVTPATKKQSDALMKTMADAGWEFDFDKKELKKIEQKPAWSEEDETITSALSQLLKDCESENSWNCVYSNDREVFFVDIENWLKSLKDRVQPKQEWSEEDESMRIRCIGILSKCYIGELPTKVEEELNWLKSSLKPQKLLTNEEIEQAKKEYRDEALSKVDYIPEELTYDDGWDDAISYMKKSLRPQT